MCRASHRRGSLPRPLWQQKWQRGKGGSCSSTTSASSWTSLSLTRTPHWWSSVISASQFKQLCLSGGTGVKTILCAGITLKRGFLRAGQTPEFLLFWRFRFTFANLNVWPCSPCRGGRFGGERTLECSLVRRKQPSGAEQRLKQSGDRNHSNDGIRKAQPRQLCVVLSASSFYGALRKFSFGKQVLSLHQSLGERGDVWGDAEQGLGAHGMEEELLQRLMEAGM